MEPSSNWCEIEATMKLLISSMKLLISSLLISSAVGLERMSSYIQVSQDLAAKLKPKPAAEKGPAAGSDPSMHWFTSQLDHFDRQNTATWQQRSFQNATFFNGSGPVFLCVGGEGPAMDASVLVASVHCNDMVELAPKVGALMLAVEHRYYGFSMPRAADGKGVVRNPLRWLSSQQALGDLANFHLQISANYSLDPAVNKWVSFGGSYPGMMAGFFRLKYPHLVHAAVSSSSPWRTFSILILWNLSSSNLIVLAASTLSWI